MGQLGFFDLNRRYESLIEKNDPLVAIAAMVPFESFRPKLNAALIKGELRRSEAERKNSAGRKPWDEVVIFKALVLQALYNLSDDQAEYQLRDRFSFMRFLGLELEDAVPDAKTLWLYREALAKAGAVEELFDLFDGFLKNKGYLARAKPKRDFAADLDKSFVSGLNVQGVKYLAHWNGGSLVGYTSKAVLFSLLRIHVRPGKISLEAIFYDRIALAGGFLETRTVENLYSPPMVVDESLLVQLLR